ncbi:MAG TPA: arginine--tRNA ligase [Frankiaceae bacterium]|nr:arginine--tRNA ligase [Frankiaceae bacterium]
MKITATTHGPAEAALAAILAASAARLTGAGADAIEVMATAPHHAHAFAIRVIAGDGADTALEAVARVLAEIAPLRRLSVRPPRIYADAEDRWFVDTVGRAVTTDPATYGDAAPTDRRPTLVMMFSNPNTNKPLHLGHLRQNVVGMALSRMYEAIGWDVRRADMLGDWGIHICQALLGYLRWGDEIGTASSALKGDHFAGRCLVRFHEENTAQRAATGDEGPTELETAARELLLAATQGDRDTLRLKRRFTRWVESGLDETHARIGTSFDAVVRESHARLRACRMFQGGLTSGVFQRRDDGSVHGDLTSVGLWDVTLFRRDSTSTAYVQHAGPEDELFERYGCDRLLFVYGPDWVAPHKVSKELYRRLDLPWQDRIEGLSHGLVSLPEGRMRSRSGTVLNVDLLLDEIASSLAASWERQPRESGGTTTEATCEQLAVALLKLAFLRVPRRLDITFDPTRLQRDVIPQLAALLAADDALAAGPVGGGEPGGIGPSRHANYFPTVVARAAAAADPADLVRFTVRCAEAARAAASRLPEEARIQFRVVLRRALQLLNIDLPLGTADLPPSLTLRARPAG